MNKEDEANKGNEQGIPAAPDQSSGIAAMMESLGIETVDKKPEENSGEQDTDKDKDKDKDKEADEDNKDDADDKKQEASPEMQAILDENESLKRKIAELTEGKKSTEKKDDEKANVPDIDEESLKKQLEETSKDLVSEYIKDDTEFDAIIEDRAKFNDMLKSVRNDGIQAVLRSIPKVVTGMISQQIYLYQKTADFYRANPDLREHGAIVGKVIDETVAKNPGMKLDDVLKFVGGDGKDDIGEIRRRLKLKQKAAVSADDINNKQRNRPPNTDRAAHVRQPSSKKLQLTGIEKEINEMLEATDT